jgi:hypothetical protein
MSVHDRIDPEVAEGLEAYFKIAGPGGLGAIPTSASAVRVWPR